jgi:hypothetical protein
VQEALSIGWRLGLAFIGANAIESLADALIWWLTCWLPNNYCPHASADVELGGALSMLREFLHDFLTFKYAQYVLMIFVPLITVIALSRHWMAALPRFMRWFSVGLSGCIVGIAFAVGSRGYASNWEEFVPIWQFTVSGAIGASLASALVWWAVRPRTWSNYAMQRSSQVVTPLAGNESGSQAIQPASGAPTARRR